MSAILLIPYYFPVSTICNYLLFFLSGLPGGIDYVLLVLTTFDVIDKLQEKKINSFLNAYFRGPFVVVGAYIVYLNYINGRIPANNLVLLFALSGLLWNAQYFTYRVIFNYGYHSRSIPQITIDFSV